MVVLTDAGVVVAVLTGVILVRGSVIVSVVVGNGGVVTVFSVET